MSNLKNFNIKETPIHGVNLIEASAGTGKTYTIAAVYLRLIIEKKIPVEKILVVTFTEAATLELKDRIRSRLKAAAKGFESGQSDDDFINHLILTSEDQNTALSRVKTALTGFDQAAVFTIHGFCQRMLVENAFESGSLFETELVGTSPELFIDALNDFWRAHFYDSTLLFSQWLFATNTSPESFLSFVRTAMKPGVTCIPQPAYQETGAIENEYIESFTGCRTEWQQAKETIKPLFLECTSFNGNKYRKKSLPVWLRTIDTCFEGNGISIALPDCFEKFTSDYMESPGSIKKGGKRPEHTFFKLCSRLFEIQGRLTACYASNLLWYKLSAVSFVVSRLGEQKQARGIAEFDDLLMHLYTGLQGKNGSVLAENIRRKYAAALIDEFQDTDPVQYSIFSTVFRHNDSLLFMIGDPKQAIYSFRGADIFAYMTAARDAESAYTLSSNYRSEPGVVNAVNTLFQNSSDPFLFKEIEFIPAKAAELENRSLCSIDDRFSFVNILQFESDTVLPKGEAVTRVPGAVSSEVIRLMELSSVGQATIDGKPLQVSDIAVLVRTNDEARTMKEEMESRKIPAVIYSSGNVFHSQEAGELRTLLRAISMPGNESVLKAALVTEMIGYTGDKLIALEHNPERFDALKERWSGYYRIWLSQGVVAMFNTLLKNETVLIRQMSFFDGERRSTNILHLIQLLNKAAIEKQLGPEMLIKWIAQQADPLKADIEEHQLQLESDADCLKIVTIHKSKGMEYPVVFCPWVWSGRMRRTSPEFCVFHDVQKTQALTLDAGSENFEEHCHIAEREELAENLRLLYVALTRAKSRCYVLWGRVKGSEKTAFGKLLYENGNEPITIPENDSILRQQLDELSQASNGSIYVETLQPDTIMEMPNNADSLPVLKLKPFRGRIDQDFKIASFSSLTSTKSHASDDKDRDPSAGRDTLHDQDATDIFAFPKGSSPGTFMHSIFEDADFTSSKSSRDELIIRKLEEYGFESKWQSAVSEMVETVLNVPLVNQEDGFSLSRLSTENRLTELEFHFPLKAISAQELNDVLTQHNAGAVSPLAEQNHVWELDFYSVKGFMKGFVDLIFRSEKQGEMLYSIVDWKSNWLGACHADYSMENLSPVMIRDRYTLQYLIYTVALDRYLTLRLGDRYSYEHSFGGVYYIFLRGVTSDTGVFYDKPDKALIRDLAALLLKDE